MMSGSREKLEELKQKVRELEEQLEREQKQADSHAPKMGHMYWFLDTDGVVLNTTWEGIDVDKTLLAFGNVYLTEEAAEKALDQKLAEVRVITRLRELDGGFVADWSNEKQTKHSVYFSHTENKFLMEHCLVCQACLPHWLSTREAWKQVIQEMESDVKLMMGVDS